MGRGKDLNDREKGQLDVMKDLGFSIKEMSRRTSRSRCAIRNYLRGDPFKKTNRPGNAKKLSVRAERTILQKASNSTISTRQLQREVAPHVSHTTVWKVLDRSQHIVRQAMNKCPNMTPAHKQKRVEFAKEKVTSRQDWSKVIFSDEKKFNLDGPDGQHYYWRDLRKDPRFFSRRNFGGGSAMCWGAFTTTGTLKIMFVSSRMDSSEYQDTLEASLLPYIRRRRAAKLVYQQDNASVHKSRSTMAWFASNRIAVMDWPACSPDLNPMENLWGIMVREVYANATTYHTVNDLKKAIEDAWKNIDKTVLKKLADSMYKRMCEVISRHGEPVDY